VREEGGAGREERRARTAIGGCGTRREREDMSAEATSDEYDDISVAMEGERERQTRQRRTKDDWEARYKER